MIQTPHRLAKLLRPFGVKSERVWDGVNQVMSYTRKSLEPIFDRYLSPLPPKTAPKLPLGHNMLISTMLPMAGLKKRSCQWQDKKMEAAISKHLIINGLQRSGSFEREFYPSGKEVYRKHAERRRFMLRDFPVTGCQLRHASSSYTSFFMLS
jgi:hypothetical protein